ncbi:alpha-N-arabinofuranosidase [Paenibacillus fonticola]|uniref:alpha-N-arabinofuranosidase n=1 Tax=Paenibacillus fonticola TaxID=379896 RepID=UPI000361AFF5|nr:alpha-L-arabinofuranosidase C-terminal domain-containing protein [Paenibacillus fonticola]
MAILYIRADRKRSVINRNIYGHFAEHLGRGIYEGIFVGKDSPIPNTRGIRTDVLNALKHIHVPVIRWPGGCFAEYYNWRDGIGQQRKKMINSSWGGVIENNAFGTHEYFDLCEQLGCATYIAANVGSGTPREVSEWVEYVTFNGESELTELRRKNDRTKPWTLDFIGIGNENWGCGGHMRPEYYADLYRQFESFIRHYGQKKIQRVACGPDGDDQDWTETVMKLAHHRMDGISLHYYTMPGYYKTDKYKWEVKASSTVFDEHQYYRTLDRAYFMDELILRHKRIMDKYDPDKNVALIVDEWGTWHLAEEGTNPAFLYQQNTMRDAIVAALTLNIFNLHSDRVSMANLAQMINVLQSLILTEGDQMVLTPTYHVFDLYKGHQNATLIETYIEADDLTIHGAQLPHLHVSASEREDGCIHLTIVNLSANEAVDLHSYVKEKNVTKAHIRYLTGAITDHNTFEHPEQVTIQSVEAIDIHHNELQLTIPCCSVYEVILA